MRPACRLLAGRMQPAAACCIMHTVVCRMHTGVIRATCRLHLEKYDLHFENAIDMKPACRLHVALSVATSIKMQLSIPGVDALPQDAVPCSRASTPCMQASCSLHAGRRVDDALN